MRQAEHLIVIVELDLAAEGLKRSFAVVARQPGRAELEVHARPFHVELGRTFQDLERLRGSAERQKQLVEYAAPGLRELLGYSARPSS